jgi:translation initiation factor IF-2
MIRDTGGHRASLVSTPLDVSDLCRPKQTMEAMASSLRPGVAYVVVLTKADKKDGKVSPTVTQVCCYH